MTKKMIIRILILAAFLAAGVLFFGVPGPVSGQTTSKLEIKKGKIYQETYPLVSESDLYCSYAVLDGPLPDLKVTGAERQEERVFFSDGDVIYVNGGVKQGVSLNQVYMLLNFRQKMKHPRTGESYGPLIQKVGRGRVIHIEDKRSILRVEKACSPVQVGDYAVLFTEKKEIIGKDKGYVPYTKRRVDATRGEVIFLGAELKQAGTGNWVLIDLGKEQGLEVGNQVTLNIATDKKSPNIGVASAVVIDVQSKTSTIKILSDREAIRLGCEVEVK
jgi:hypothetical protein